MSGTICEMHDAQVKAWADIQNYLPGQNLEDEEDATPGAKTTELRSVRDAVQRAQDEFGIRFIPRRSDQACG